MKLEWPLVILLDKAAMQQNCVKLLNQKQKHSLSIIVSSPGWLSGNLVTQV